MAFDSAGGIPEKSAENVGRKPTGKTAEKENAIVAYLTEHGESKSAEIAASVGLGISRTNELLRGLVEGGVVKAQGGSRNRTYRIAE